jgi:hypothetical protein
MCASLSFFFRFLCPSPQKFFLIGIKNDSSAQTTTTKLSPVCAPSVSSLTQGRGPDKKKEVPAPVAVARSLIRSFLPKQGFARTAGVCPAPPLAGHKGWADLRGLARIKVSPITRLLAPHAKRIIGDNDFITPLTPSRLQRARPPLQVGSAFTPPRFGGRRHPPLLWGVAPLSCARVRRRKRKNLTRIIKSML